ncbi:MAG: hypothetical protein EXR79_15345 [Myxococcales bacterium]|nr:hypothetical protein [Myxococcales bacterium]
MHELTPFLELTGTDAAGQWRKIQHRKPAERQEAFLPVETLLANGLFFVLRPNRYGGGNIGTAARLFIQAYAKSHEPALVFNAARAYDQGGKARDAVALFRLYLTLATDGAGLAAARERIQRLENAAAFMLAGRSASIDANAAPVTSPRDFPAYHERFATARAQWWTGVALSAAGAGVATWAGWVWRARDGAAKVAIVPAGAGLAVSGGF